MVIANMTTSEKMVSTKPYNIFFNTTNNSQGTNTITFKDLLCSSLGEIKASLQINFLVDLLWLYEQYSLANCQTKPLTVLYGFAMDYDEEETTVVLNKIMPSVKYYLIETSDIFGTNHSRLAIFEYVDGTIRIAVFTANLKDLDWNSMNQSIWLSEPCPKMAPHHKDTECSGPTDFKKVLVNYLKEYKLSAALTDWINLIRRADFSNVKVCLITSVPGPHYIKGVGCHVLDMAYYLKKYCILPDSSMGHENTWSIITAVASLGSYGDSATGWLTSLFLRSLGRHKSSTSTSPCNVDLCVVYPSQKNIKSMTLCLPDGNGQHGKKDYQQDWLKMFLYQWKADKLKRTSMVPYSKSYCRISPCLTKLAWYLMTSANLTKSDWGVKWDSDVYARSWELGILFMPNFFEMEYFPLKEDHGNGQTNSFPLMYDLPLVPYESDDIAY